MSIDELNEQNTASDNRTDVRNDDLDAVSGGVGHAFTKNCLMCGHPLDKKSNKCPNCGYKMPSHGI